MRISVDTDNVKLIEKDPIESGEYNVTPCLFIFTDEYENLIKTAVFTKKGTSYKMSIIHNQCQIPYEVLNEEGATELGVYGYEETNNELVLRYSPKPCMFNVTKGSYKENAENSTPPTPTQFEQYEKALEEGLEEVQNVDIDVSKEDDTATIVITNRYGTQKEVTIKDGERGQQGPAGQDGQDGYTPIKGVDYYTSQDIADMEADVKAAVEQEIPDVSDFITKDVNNLTYYTKTTDMNDAINLKQNITDNTLQTTNKTIPTAINEVNSIAKGANQSLSYNNYSSMVTTFNSLGNNVYNVGQNVMIITLEVPDLWVSSIESTSVPYTYTTDEAITTALSTNGYIQVGYYKLSALETQKVDLRDYAKTTDVPTQLSQLSDDSTHRLVTDTEKSTWSGKGTYSKPSGGIPKTDLASAVQTSLGKADTAIQNTDYASQNVGGVIKAWTSYNEDNELGLNISTQ